MYKPQLPHLILIFSGVLFCFTSHPQTRVYGSEVPEQSPLSEESIISPNDDTEGTTSARYSIHQLHFRGNAHLNEKKLITLFGWKKEESYSRQEMIEGFERIITAYRDAGFIFAETAPTITMIAEGGQVNGETPVSIRVEIVEGKQLRTGMLTLVGNQRFSEADIRDELGLKTGTLFTPGVLERGIERLQTLYSEHGYPKIEIEPKNIQLLPKTGTINFELNIREGTQIRIGDVKISGLKKTKTGVVLREMHVKPNDPFTQRDIDTSYRRLRNLGYFYQVNPNVLEAGETEDKINFHARVTEARTGQLSGVIGYAPPDSDVDAAPQLTGVFEARETNLLGTGRQVNLYWKSGLLKVLRFGYAEPWIFGKPLTIGIEYGQLEQRMSDRGQLQSFSDNASEIVSEEQSGSVSATTNFGRVFEGMMTLGYKRINVPNVGSPLGAPPSLEPQTPILTDPGPISPIEPTPYIGTKSSITLRLTRDTRDYFLNPTRGRRDSIAFEMSRSDFRLRKAWLSLQQYFPTWRKQTIAVELHGAAAWGFTAQLASRSNIAIPPTELFYLGGSTTLRGYDEDWFSGPRRVYANLEYRFLVGPDSQVFVFTDLGAVTLIETPSVFDTLRVGYGFGARLESRGGILRINYGLAAGDSLFRGKIHVNLGAAF